MKPVERVHSALVHPRRVEVLARRAAQVIPADVDVLDVGCGDGLLASVLMRERPDVRVRGLDVLVRDHTAIPVEPFDGRHIPRANRSVDVVTFFDVLHHAGDPAAVLREAVRVARVCVVLKDHIADGAVAGWTLRFMDRVGNARHGVSLPHNYWSSRQWSTAIQDLGVSPAVWQVGGLGLYPWPASLVFGRGLHVFARLDVPGG